MKFYTCEEVAGIFKVKVETVYRWIKDGRLDYHEISYHVYRISEADLKKFAEGRQKAQ